MSNPRFDLVDIAQTLRAKSKLLLIGVVVSAMIGGLFYVVGKKNYKAEADFIISNPLYADRNNLFRTRDTRFVDYFGGDDDIDRVLIISQSDSLRNYITDKLNLWEAYKLDKDDPEDRLAMKERFQNKFKMQRTEYTTAKVYFTDTDAERAAEVVNLAIDMSEKIFRGYYIKMKNNVSNSITKRIGEIDVEIESNVMQLVALSKSLKAAKSNSADAMMTITKISEIKAVNEQLIKDKARNKSLLNEFKAGVDQEDMNRYLQVITPATPPAEPAGVGLALTIIGAAFFGFFFIAIYILIVSYYKLLLAVER